ncbi:ABC transporter ATP-binding protein [Paenibacillus xerothermodurans]|uniref:ABC transporter ATP-binding protein n=1 Tax=Paenibacillus xerothermodurans TaxID=1977292 RepID=A0A2W1NMW9_PAEXE|nr:ABC transporter ATP-binding protein [Paenibacillus xerothermodurans]PZE20815.1 ABC transporter ATP-binding protein [Paenibacillus xerothermodurans]
MPIINVQNVGKRYKRYSTNLSRLAEWISRVKRHEEKWVLQDISFQMEKGESMGIIGHNGAGKSTLLKILTGTTKPSQGSMEINGRVSALLELGLGFHPDFTGVENIYMLGQLMGLNNQEITTVLPDIIDFAEIGDYIHQPLRTYSSGMGVRLAFATVTAVRPDILIVDEALSVGDAYFQHKCFNRIRTFRMHGTSLLFVSHDPIAVKNLCDRAILLDNGQLIKDGLPDEVMDYYNAIIAKREADAQIAESIGLNNKKAVRSGNKDIEIEEVSLESNGAKINALQVAEHLDIKITVRANKEILHPTVGFVIKDRLGNEVFGTNTFHLNYDLDKFEKDTTYTVIFSQKLNIGTGTYSITAAVHDSYHHLDKNYDWLEQAATFQVISGAESSFVGVVYLDSSVHLEREVVSCPSSP